MKRRGLIASLLALSMGACGRGTLLDADMSKVDASAGQVEADADESDADANQIDLDDRLTDVDGGQIEGCDAARAWGSLKGAAAVDA